jgi:hypothetical protein
MWMSVPFSKVVIPAPAGSARTNTPVPSSESIKAMIGSGVGEGVCEGVGVLVRVAVALGLGEGVRLAVGVADGGNVALGVNVGNPIRAPNTAPAPVKPMKTRMLASNMAAPREYPNGVGGRKPMTAKVIAPHSVAHAR